MASHATNSSPGLEPIHKALLTSLRDRANHMSPGERFPSIRALMGQHNVAQVTVERCLSHLEAQGAIERRPRSGTYVLDRKLRRMRLAPDTSIEAYGLVLPSVDDPLYAPLIGRFTEASQSTFHEVMVSSTNLSVDRQGDVLMGLLEKKVAAVVVLPVPFAPSPPHQFRLLQKNNVPVILLHRPVGGISAPVLRLPAKQIGQKAAQVLIQNGHRCVAALVGENEIADAYVSGLCEEFERVGGSYCDVLARWIPGALPNNYEKTLGDQLAKLLQMPKNLRPTAFFVPQDGVAESAYIMLREMGVKVGEDISLICLGGAWRRTIVSKRLTAVTLDEAWAAEHAIEMIEEMRNGQRSMFDSTVLDIPLGFHAGCTVNDLRRPTSNG